MPRSRGALLLAAAAALAAADAALLALEPRAPGELGFARLSGGLGLSAASGVEWSFHAFDPRLEPGCENELGPLPGGFCPDPVHGAGVANFTDAFPP